LGPQNIWGPKIFGALCGPHGLHNCGPGPAHESNQWAGDLERRPRRSQGSDSGEPAPQAPYPPSLPSPPPGVAAGQSPCCSRRRRATLPHACGGLRLGLRGALDDVLLAAEQGRRGDGPGLLRRGRRSWWLRGWRPGRSSGGGSPATDGHRSGGSGPWLRRPTR
jgi:hypothetical protein